MNQQSFGQKAGHATAPGPDATSGNSSVKSQQEPAAVKPGTRNQAVLGHFTVRDLAVFAGTLILFVASLLPVFFDRFNLWNAGSLFFLGLGIVLPLVVSAMFAARRLAPGTKIRVGSLSVDQFASVISSFTLAFFFLTVAADYRPALLAGLVGSVVLFAATVLGRFIPYFAGDFQGREEIPAHVVAREAAAPLPKPHTPKAAKESKPAANGSPAAVSPARTAAVAGSGAAAAAAAAVHSSPQAVTTPGTSPAAQSAPAAHSGPSAQAAPGAPAAGSNHPAPAEQAAGLASPSAGEDSSAADRSAASDAGPATQAADVVPPARVAAADETQAADVPAAAQSREGSEPIAATAVHQQVRHEEPIGATVDPASRPEESDDQPVHEAFWFAVAQHRTAVDPRTGAPAFVIEPGGWVLALEDRGHEFLVQHTDGRVGVLRDLSNIERG